MKTLTILVSIITLGIFASPLMAQEAAPQEEMPQQEMPKAELPNFASVDANTDGFLSEQEITDAGATIKVDEADKNDDDLISRIEYQDLVNARSEG